MKLPLLHSAFANVNATLTKYHLPSFLNEFREKIVIVTPGIMTENIDGNSLTHVS